MLSYDDGRGKRGLMIALVHKFGRDGISELIKELEKQSDINDTISGRKNVIAFVDEVQRTQYGSMAAQDETRAEKGMLFRLHWHTNL